MPVEQRKAAEAEAKRILEAEQEARALAAGRALTGTGAWSHRGRVPCQSIRQTELPSQRITVPGGKDTHTQTNTLEIKIQFWSPYFRQFVL